MVEALQSHLKDGVFFDRKRTVASSVLDNGMRFFEGIQGNQGQASTPAESSKISAVESKPVPSESAPVSWWSRITGFFSGLFRTRSLATDGPSEQPVVSEPAGKDADTSTAPSKVEASTITAVTNEVEAQLRIACERGQRRASDNWSSAVVHVAVIGIVEAPRRS